MNNSEKCYYAVIENKKRGKFYGASPSQVAKKVASKKLKAGKEIEFYLDEAGGKNKRYGPYQARKDKKTGKVSVIKARKVMKGGLLSSSDKQILTTAFNNQNNVIVENNYITNVDVDIRFYYKSPPFFVKSLLIFFEPEQTRKYKYAIFVEPNGRYLWILQKKNNDVEFINFCEFFLNPNPEYLNSVERKKIVMKLLQILQFQPIIRPREGNIIKSFLEKIQSVIYPPVLTTALNIAISPPVSTPTALKKVAIYFPDYSRPLIRKCVYPDLTFGILDEKTPTRIPQNTNDFPTPESLYQKYLIYKNTGISGMSFNEPIIYVRVVNIIKIQCGGTLTAQQIQAKINILKTDLKSLKTHQSYIKKLVNNQEVLKPQQNVGYKLPKNVLNKQQKNKDLLIELNNQITEIENEIQNIQTRQQQQHQSQLNQQQLQQQQLQSQLNQQQLQQQLQQQQLQQQLHPQQLQQQLNHSEQVQCRRSIGTNNIALEQFRRELKLEQQQQLHFDYCIFSSGNKLKIMSYDKKEVQDFILIGPNLLSIPIQIFYNLIDIPPLFGEFQRIIDISDRRIRQMNP